MKVFAIILIAAIVARTRQRKSKLSFRTNQSEAGRIASFFLFPVYFFLKNKKFYGV
jgi:hypothetical protein